MKQIKTIYCRDAEHFDRTVNQALKEGWQLTRRAFDQFGFIAEMEKEIKEEEPKEEPKEKHEEEQSCDNCKHYKKGTKEEPCSGCSLDADKWEPKEEREEENTPNEQDRRCQTCKHEFKSLGTYPCSVCGDASYRDKWEPFNA